MDCYAIHASGRPLRSLCGHRHGDEKKKAAALAVRRALRTSDPTLTCTATNNEEPLKYHTTQTYSYILRKKNWYHFLPPFISYGRNRATNKGKLTLAQWRLYVDNSRRMARAPLHLPHTADSPASFASPLVSMPMFDRYSVGFAPTCSSPRGR